MESTTGFRVPALGMESPLQKQMEHAMETEGFVGIDL